MCNAIMLGMIWWIGVDVGITESPWFLIAYVAAIFFNSNWWQRKEKRWLGV